MLLEARVTSFLTWDRSRSVAVLRSPKDRRKATTCLHRARSRPCSALKYSLKDWKKKQLKHNITREDFYPFITKFIKQFTLLSGNLKHHVTWENRAFHPVVMATFTCSSSRHSLSLMSSSSLAACQSWVSLWMSEVKDWLAAVA